LGAETFGYSLLLGAETFGLRADLRGQRLDGGYVLE
jgi:hypothetical protein